MITVTTFCLVAYSLIQGLVSLLMGPCIFIYLHALLNLSDDDTVFS